MKAVFVCALAVLSVALSLPVLQEKNQPVVEPHQALEFASASYCKIDTLRVGKWDCKVCGNYTKGFIPTFITSPNSWDTYAIIGHIDAEIFVVFRGSETLQNWITDAKFFHADGNYTNCPDCRVHRGFQSAYDIRHDEITDHVIALSKTLGSKKVTVIGHSLGGALATPLCLGSLPQPWGVPFIDYLWFPPCWKHRVRQVFQ
eukprot:JP446172.1.p2 GENE.JP446172.1~~JP446172.1.p2  ORF type:complete len:202 (-),score=34.82 JP446172.1:847-1452(-)